VILTFFEISHNCFLLEKSWIMSMDNGTRLALGPWWTHDHGAARPHRGSGSHCDSSERERGRLSEFSPMASHGGEAPEMATR
jgi:hypothetical protein